MILFVVKKSMENPAASNSDLNLNKSSVSDCSNGPLHNHNDAFRFNEEVFVDIDSLECTSSTSALNEDRNKKNEASEINSMGADAAWSDSINKEVIFDSDSESDDEDFSDFNKANTIDNGIHLDTDGRIMFPASNITVSDVVLMLKGINLRFNITREMEIALLQMFKTLAGSKFES